MGENGVVADVGRRSRQTDNMVPAMAARGGERATRGARSSRTHNRRGAPAHPESLAARRLRESRVADSPACSRRSSAPPRNSRPVSPCAIASSSVSAVDCLAPSATLESGWPRPLHSLRDAVSTSPCGLRHPDELPKPRCAHGPSYGRTRRLARTALKKRAHKYCDGAVNERPHQLWFPPPRRPDLHL